MLSLFVLSLCAQANSDVEIMPRRVSVWRGENYYINIVDWRTCVRQIHCGTRWHHPSIWTAQMDGYNLIKDWFSVAKNDDVLFSATFDDLCPSSWIPSTRHTYVLVIARQKSCTNICVPEIHSISLQLNIDFYLRHSDPRAIYLMW